MSSGGPSEWDLYLIRKEKEEIRIGRPLTELEVRALQIEMGLISKPVPCGGA